MHTQLKGLLITGFGVLCVVPDALFVKLIDADAMTIAFWRMLLSGLMVLAMLTVRHGCNTPAQLLSIGRWGIVYAFFVAISALLFVTSVKLTSVANTTIIIASMPVFAAIISWLTLGETLSRRMIWTIVLVFAGLLVIGYGTIEAGAGSSSLIGDLAAVAVSLFFAIALTAARKARARSMIPALPLAYISCAILLLPFVDPFSVPNSQWWLVIMHGGVFIAAGSCMLALGPRYISSAEVALLILLESVLAPLLAWLVISEQPGAWTLAGGSIVLAVLCVSNLIALQQRNRIPTM